MKKIYTILILFIFSYLPSTVNAQEYYFKFSEKDINKVNTVVTNTVSIDNLIGDTVYAYANQEELIQIKKLGYTLEMLPHPSSSSKNRAMATTVDGMANWDKYPTYEVYRELVKKFEQDYPELCKLDSIGTTVYGRKLYVVKISDNVLEDEAEPEFFYTSSMHGDETTGKILMLRLIDSLLTTYGKDTRITNLVNNVAIYINPNANPDGTYYGGNHSVDYATRYNGNGKDLNRNFPDPRVGENPNGTYQPETLAMMAFAESRNFVLSANFHGGIELANYPWDSWLSSTNPHPDQNWYYTVSRQYADSAQANSPSGYFTAMNNGVTHGGDWYVISGGRQDYMNYWHHCREITLEISNTKNPPSSDLPKYWNYNKEAILAYLENILTGVQGTVTNVQGDPLSAEITITGHDKDNSFVVTNSNHGNYVRMISPSTRNITYSADDYESLTVNGVVVTSGETSMVNVVLGGEVANYSVSGVITDYDASEAIADAIIQITSLEGQNSTTSNEMGEFFLEDILGGIVKFEISANGFSNAFYMENISKNSGSFNFRLINIPSYTVTFEVLNQQSEAVEGVEVTFDEIVLSSDQNGLAVFDGVFEGTYTYQAVAEGYQVVESEVSVSQDEHIAVNLIPTGVGIDRLKPQVNLWPNPFANFLEIEVDLVSNSNILIEVFTVTGHKVKTIANSVFAGGIQSFRWSPSNNSNSNVSGGVYIIKVTTNEGMNSYRVIFSPTHR